MGTNIEIPIENDHNPDRLLERHGKSFHWARYFLGKETAQKATRLYAFCRYLDDIADDISDDEFTCTICFMVLRNTQLAKPRAKVCIDCV